MGDPAPFNQPSAPSDDAPAEASPSVALTGTATLASAEAPPPASDDPSPAGASAPFEFTGTQREFFRIWIVNTFLTLATLGFYAAWAKVRNKRYLYGSTRLLGHAFDFTAEPRRLLAGNVVVVILFLGYVVFGDVYWQVKLATLAIGAGIVPWLIARALAFNARNSVHRGLRLRFRGKYGSAFGVYVCLPIATIVSLGGLYPYFAYHRKKYAVDNLRFGDCPFEFTGRPGAFYRIYFRALLWVLAPVIVGAVIGGILGAIQQIHLIQSPAYLYSQSVLAFVFFSIARIQVQAARFNYVWNHTTAAAHRFTASMSFGPLLKLQAVNTLAILVTLGLALPWARIRSTRYTLSSLQFVPAGPLDNIERLGTSGGSAVGESAADFFGVDIGL